MDPFPIRYKALCWTLTLVLSSFKWHEAHGRIGKEQVSVEPSPRVRARLGRSLQRILDDEKDTNEPINVIVGFVEQIPSYSVFSFQTNLYSNSQSNAGLARVNASTMRINANDVQALLNDPNVAYVELDEMMYPDDIIYPYGVAMTQGDTPETTTWAASSYPLSGDCSDQSSFKIAIIDSGLHVDHVDIPCVNRHDPHTNCKGKSFDLDPSETIWYRPGTRHGKYSVVPLPKLN